jgi:hypothetical protein
MVHEGASNLIVGGQERVSSLSASVSGRSFDEGVSTSGTPTIKESNQVVQDTRKPNRKAERLPMVTLKQEQQAEA